MNNPKIIKQSEKYMRQHIPKSRINKASYLRHILGARKYAIKLAKQKNADLFIIEIAALLHDIGADVGKDSKGRKLGHAKESAKIAKEFLSKFEIDKKTHNEIIQGIARHSMGSKIDTIEQQIIQDADGLIFLEDTYQYFFQNGKKRADSLDEAKKWSVDKVKGMLDKIKTKEGVRMAKKLLPRAIEWIEGKR
jgi:uncharacterized protein